MGMLIRGEWKDVWYDTASTGGAFERKESAFRHRVSDAPDARFRPEAGRYHLYVSYACPWAHRTLIVRALKGLEDAIDVTVVDPFMAEQGWVFPADAPEPLYGLRRLHELYTKADPDYSGRVTVPILWDKREQTIVNNESAEIIRLLNTNFNAFARQPELDLYPEPLRPAIDRWNERVYPAVNNGVYRAGFATTQEAYDSGVHALFEALDEIDAHLDSSPYLAGDRLTEADWRLFTTLVRFDWVYHGHFKCNVRRLVDYPNLFPYVRELYQHPGVAPTVQERHIKEHYYRSHPTINPTRIVPAGPHVDFSAPHGRG
ncbi:MAG: glutathione S-transferase family protein [Polyangiaceae bacterium]|jgi:putative glutathione S-transferase|nr:glutathione S-transferase family protein [Polyangiaceae bacterium]